MPVPCPAQPPTDCRLVEATACCLYLEPMPMAVRDTPSPTRLVCRPTHVTQLPAALGSACNGGGEGGGRNRRLDSVSRKAGNRGQSPGGCLQADGSRAGTGMCSSRSASAAGGINGGGRQQGRPLSALHAAARTGLRVQDQQGHIVLGACHVVPEFVVVGGIGGPAGRVVGGVEGGAGAGLPEVRKRGLQLRRSTEQQNPTGVVVQRSLQPSGLPSSPGGRRAAGPEASDRTLREAAPVLAAAGVSSCSKNQPLEAHSLAMYSFPPSQPHLT